MQDAASAKRAFEAAMRSDQPALVEVVTDVEVITPEKTLEEIRNGRA